MEAIRLVEPDTGQIQLGSLVSSKLGGPTMVVSKIVSWRPGGTAEVICRWFEYRGRIGNRHLWRLRKCRFWSDELEPIQW